MSIATSIEETVLDAVDVAIPIVEAIGASVVFVGAVLAFGTFVLAQVRVRPASYESIRLLLGRYLALGLEFQLGADILSTAISPTFEDLGKLAAIAAIRTILNFFLQQELREEAARVGRDRGDRGERGGSKAAPT